MILQLKTNTSSGIRTANIFGVGVNAVSLGASASLHTAFSEDESTYSNSRVNPNYKLPSLLFGFGLFLAAVTKVTAVLFKIALKLVNAILEIAPRGILFFLSLANVVFSHVSLSSAEWSMKSKDDEDNSHFCSNDLPLFPLYVQHSFYLYE